MDKMHVGYIVERIDCIDKQSSYWNGYKWTGFYNLKDNIVSKDQITKDLKIEDGYRYSAYEVIKKYEINSVYIII